MRNLEVAKNLLVESVLAFQQRLQTAQERAGFGALHHAMIVGAGDRHHLAEAQLRAQLLGHAVILGRIVDGAGGDDRALARHQPRHRAQRANGPGIGQRNGGAFEIRHRQLVIAGAKNDVVERRDELREVHATPASLMLGTFSDRAPSLPATSTAMPMLTWSRTTRNGWPLVSA